MIRPLHNPLRNAPYVSFKFNAQGLTRKALFSVTFVAFGGCFRRRAGMNGHTEASEAEINNKKNPADRPTDLCVFSPRRQKEA